MKSRIFNFSSFSPKKIGLLKYFLYSPIIAFSYSSVVQAKASRYAKKELQKNKTTIYSIEEKRIATTMEKAFQDTGVKYPIHIIFKKDLHTISSMNFFNDSFQRNVLLEVDKKLSSNHENEMYAVAGHEAIHCLHEHGAKEIFIRSYLQYLVIYRIWNSMRTQGFSRKIVGIFALLATEGFDFFAKKIINRHHEKSADILSVKRLQTKESLMKFLEEEHKETEKYAYPNRLKYLLFFYDFHPSLKERIKYLSALKNSK